MSFAISNLSSYRIQNDLTNVFQNISENVQKLSTGKRINSAVDNPAGLAISQRLQSQITGDQTGNQNIGEGIALSQTAEGGLQVIQNQLQKLRQLAIEAQNGTNSSTDVNALQQEANQILLGINHIAETTNYNGINLLSGYTNPLTQENWVASNTSISGVNFESIAFGNGKFTALDFKGYSYTSTDGIHWTKSTSKVAGGGLFGILWNGKQFVIGSYNNQIYTSQDGIHWTKQNTPVSSNTGSGAIELGQIGNKTIAVDNGNHVVMSSSNGQDWSKISNLPGIVSGLAYGNGVLVGLDWNGHAYVSSNYGASWSTISVPSSPNFESITWNGKQFVGVDYYGGVWSSSKGTTWSKTGTTPSGSHPDSIQYLNGTYYVTDYKNGNVYESTNGTTWITQSTPSQTRGLTVDGFAYGHDQIVSTTGYSSSTPPILQSTPESSSITIQTGSNLSDQLNVQLSNVTLNSFGIQTLSLTSPNALRLIDHAINATIYEEQKYGQFQTVLNSQQQNNLSQATNEKQANSTITDANMTQQMSNLTKNRILMQTDIAMLNQVNQESKIYLSLYSHLS